MRAGKRSRRHRSVEDGRFKGASPRPGKRADIAKILGARQRRKATNPAICAPNRRNCAENSAAWAWTSAIARILYRPRAGRFPFFLGPSKNRGGGAPGGATSWSTPCGVSTLRQVFGDGCAPSGAPLRLFCPRDRIFRVRDGGLFALLIRRASARLRPHRVQPSKAAGRRAGGRLPEASRVRGYEPRPQAPHPVPSSKRLAKTPLGGPDATNIKS